MNLQSINPDLMMTNEENNVKKYAQLFMIILMVMVLGVFLVFLVTFPSAASEIDAAPLQAPRVVTIFPTTAITLDTYSSNFIWGMNTHADLFYIIDQGVGNEIDFDLFVSPQAVNWYAHITYPQVLTDSTGDTSGYIDSVPINGYQARLFFDVVNTEVVTVGVVAVLRGY